MGWKILISGSKKKFIAIGLIITIVMSFVLFIFGAMSQLLFWIVVAVIAFIAYKILPK